MLHYIHYIYNIYLYIRTYIYIYIYIYTTMYIYNMKQSTLVHNFVICMLLISLMVLVACCKTSYQQVTHHLHGGSHNKDIPFLKQNDEWMYVKWWREARSYYLAWEYQSEWEDWKACDYQKQMQIKTVK